MDDLGELNSDTPRQPLLVLVGPTGTGKTAVGIELCRLLNGEIVSADSMQVYRHCDICTAKLSAHELLAAPHHLIDIRDPWENYSAAQWAADAAAAIAAIARRGKRPLVVGGTGFYIRALLEPASLAIAPPNLDLRAELEAEAAREGKEALHARLAALDAAAAGRLHPNDVRRVIRALEVAMAPRDSTALQPEPMPGIPAYEAHVFGLDLPRPELYARLDQRVDAMVQAGAVDEVRRLLAMGVDPAASVLQGVGYRQILPALAQPDTLSIAIELWKRETRRYAKRQLTWFRHQLPVQWVDAGGEANATAAIIAAQWRGRSDLIVNAPAE